MRVRRPRAPPEEAGVEVPLPILVVQRAEPEGVDIKGTMSERPAPFRLPTESCRSCEPWLLIGTQTPVCS